MRKLRRRESWLLTLLALLVATSLPLVGVTAEEPEPNAPEVGDSAALDPSIRALLEASNVDAESAEALLHRARALRSSYMTSQGSEGWNRPSPAPFANHARLFAPCPAGSASPECQQARRIVEMEPCTKPRGCRAYQAWQGLYGEPEIELVEEPPAEAGRPLIVLDNAGRPVLLRKPADSEAKTESGSDPR